MYDGVATILGLGQLTAADGHLQRMEKALDAAAKSAEAEVPELVAVPGCHYHQYEIGPSVEQVRVWRREVHSAIALLST